MFGKKYLLISLCNKIFLVGWFIFVSSFISADKLKQNIKFPETYLNPLNNALLFCPDKFIKDVSFNKYEIILENDKQIRANIKIDSINQKFKIKTKKIAGKKFEGYDVESGQYIKMFIDTKEFWDYKGLNNDSMVLYHELTHSNEVINKKLDKVEFFNVNLLNYEPHVPSPYIKIYFTENYYKLWLDIYFNLYKQENNNLNISELSNYNFEITLALGEGIARASEYFAAAVYKHGCNASHNKIIQEMWEHSLYDQVNKKNLKYKVHQRGFFYEIGALAVIRLYEKYGNFWLDELSKSKQNFISQALLLNTNYKYQNDNINIIKQLFLDKNKELNQKNKFYENKFINEFNNKNFAKISVLASKTEIEIKSQESPLSLIDLKNFTNNSVIAVFPELSEYSKNISNYLKFKPFDNEIIYLANSTPCFKQEKAYIIMLEEKKIHTKKFNIDKKIYFNDNPWYCLSAIP